MKVLITGATGFLGSHLTRALNKEGYEIIVLKRSYSNTEKIADIIPSLTVYNTDQCPIEQPFRECGVIDAVIHTATMYDRKNERYSSLLDANVQFPLQLLETANSFQTKLFINTDSFIHKNPNNYKHLAGYATSKQQFLQWLKLYRSKGNMRLINMRLEHVYGPCDNRDKFFSYIIQNCSQHVPELKLTLGKQKRDFIYVSDVVSAYSLVLRNSLVQLQGFQEFEVGMGYSISVREFVEEIHRQLRSKTKLYFGALAYHENEIMDSKAANRELKQLGWSPKVDLLKGIQLSLENES